MCKRTRVRSFHTVVLAALSLGALVLPHRAPPRATSADDALCQAPPAHKSPPRPAPMGTGSPLESCALSSELCLPFLERTTIATPKPLHKNPKNLASRARLTPYSPAVSEKTLCVPQQTWTIGLRKPDIAVDLSRLEPWVRYFTESETGRAMTAKWIKRSGRHHHAVVGALVANGLPRDLEALVFVESGYSETAKSHAGAVGLFQFMDKTGRDYDLTITSEYDQRKSIEAASDAGARHLSDLYTKFGNWELVLAAYNLGAKTVLKRMTETGAMDFWSLAAIEGALPKETVQYVPQILTLMLILRNPDRFGFDHVEKEAPVMFTDLSVPPGTAFATLARAAGTSVRKIRELNPEIAGPHVPLRLGWLAVHLPAKGWARARTMLPYLLDTGSTGPEFQVGDDFDWGRDTLPALEGKRPSESLALIPKPKPVYRRPTSLFALPPPAPKQKSPQH